MRYLIFLFVPLLASCTVLDSLDHVKPRSVIKTPKGADVLKPLPTWREGQTDAQVLQWVDDRIDQWIAQHPERTPDELRSIAHKYTFKLIDHFRFQSPKSDTGFAEGQIFYDSHYILVSLYTKQESVAQPATVPYPWMIEQRDGLWKWGVFPADGKGFAVIPHELEHALKGHFH